MGFFSRKKKTEEPKLPRGFYEVGIKEVKKLTSLSVQVVLDIPAELKDKFHFTPGQYLNFSITLNGQEFRRSYSICSGVGEDLSIAVKAIENGNISHWFKDHAASHQTILCSPPEGNFILKDEHKNIVAFAGGSGITPILSIAKKINETGRKMRLIYGNSNEEATIFKNEIDALSAIQALYYYMTPEGNDGRTGMLDREHVEALIQEDLDILKADAFFLCGPIGMIEAVEEKLLLFGVSKDKIKKELFTAPVATESQNTAGGDEMASTVTVILEGERIPIHYKPKGKGIIDQLNAEGYDPPYSCRGGVCSSCKSKILEGTAKMKLNYALTDEEVAAGYILCCQAIPTSEKVTISFDE